MSKTQIKDKELHKRINKAAAAINEADAMLIVTGVGMGLDSGLPDFRGKKGFWRTYPIIKKLGLEFEEIAHPKWFDRNPRLAWGFYGHRHNLYQRTTPHSGYAQLLEMSKSQKQGYFTLTSTVDGQLQTAGFGDNRIEECHGSIHYLQCIRPCTNDIWHANNLEIGIDSETFQAVGGLPFCHHCGSVARPNIMMFHDTTWIGRRTKKQGEHLWKWLEDLMVHKHHLVIVEIGASTKSTTLRQRSEFYAKTHHATLIRINIQEPDVPKSRHIALPLPGAAAIEEIWQLWNTNHHKDQESQN